MNFSLCATNEIMETAVTGKTILDLALQHLGEPYHAGVLVPMNDPNWRGPWDCAEFASWLIFQTTGFLYGTRTQDKGFADAYTGYWGEQAEQDGTIISIESAASIEGAFLLRKPRAQKRGHIVISDGNGGTIEAHNKTKGVVIETLSDRNFDYGILVPGIQYS